MSENKIELSIQDIAACVQLIDLVTTRGAFQGAEMLQVGGLRERLATFVQATQAAQTAPVSDAEPEVAAFADENNDK